MKQKQNFTQRDYADAPSLSYNMATIPKFLTTQTVGQTVNKRCSPVMLIRAQNSISTKKSIHQIWQHLPKLQKHLPIDPEILLWRLSLHNYLK